MKKNVFFVFKKNQNCERVFLSYKTHFLKTILKTSIFIMIQKVMIDTYDLRCNVDFT